VPANPYRGHRFPEGIISQCVWLYFIFAVSLREVELMMAFRGVQLSYETIRRWCDKVGASYAAKLKRRRPKLGDKWFLDEVFLKINGVQHYLWRAVDQHGAVIDILVQPKRDRFAAIRFFREAVTHHRTQASCDRYGQTPQLWSGQEGRSSPRGSSAKPLFEQSSRELASTDPTTRAENEALQITRPRATLLRSARHPGWLISGRGEICSRQHTTEQNEVIGWRHGRK
jgi:hypothetical protein